MILFKSREQIEVEEDQKKKILVKVEKNYMLIKDMT
jgi:hypothetical protein